MQVAFHTYPTLYDVPSEAKRSIPILISSSRPLRRFFLFIWERKASVNKPVHSSFSIASGVEDSRVIPSLRLTAWVYRITWRAAESDTNWARISCYSTSRRHIFLRLSDRVLMSNITHIPPPLPPRRSMVPLTGQSGHWRNTSQQVHVGYTVPPPAGQSPTTDRYLAYHHQSSESLGPPALPPRPVSWNGMPTQHLPPPPPLPPPPVPAPTSNTQALYESKSGVSQGYESHHTPPPRPPKEPLEPSIVGPPVLHAANPSIRHGNQINQTPESRNGGYRTSGVPLGYVPPPPPPGPPPIFEVKPTSLQLSHTFEQAGAPPQREGGDVVQSSAPRAPSSTSQMHNEGVSGPHSSGSVFVQNEASSKLNTQRVLPEDPQSLYFPPPPGGSQSPSNSQHGELESLLDSLSLEGSWQGTSGNERGDTFSQQINRSNDSTPLPAPPPLRPLVTAAPKPTVPKRAAESDSTKARPEVITCIDFASTFVCTWRWHSSSPNFLICPHCYDKSIAGTQFDSSFQSARLGDDGNSRLCKFSQPRMEKVLWPQALSSGSLITATEWMQLRSGIHSCKGADGVRGGEGHAWYRITEAEGGSTVPGFLACQACYEDRILVCPSFASKFELVPSGLHNTKDIWSCDVAIPYVKRAFEATAEANDWQNFLLETRARLQFPKCPGINKSSTHQVAWFVPINGPSHLMLCLTCYCDQIVLSGEENRWREATELKTLRGNEARCAMGNLNLRVCMAQAKDKKDMAVFWDALRRLVEPAHGQQPPQLQEELCKAAVQTNGVWYTLRNNPDEFGVCRACYILMAEPLGLGRFFELKRNVPPGQAMVCCLNLRHPRGPVFFTQFIESYAKADTSALESSASVWARIPPCTRSNIMDGMSWYGWADCSICRECFHNFASKYPNMVEAMQFRDQIIPKSVMCEMYSPRMRKLYEEVSVSQPPNVARLLEYSAHRRAVYIQTIPQIRNIIQQQKIDLERQQMANIMSTHHMSMGYIEQLSFGDSGYRYSAPGVGYGFENREFLKAEDYRQQASRIVRNGQTSALEVDMLEQRWKVVE